MKKHFILATALGFTVFNAAAQQTIKVIAGTSGMYPTFVEFAAGSAPDFTPGRVLLKTENGFVSNADAALRHSEPDNIGEEHFRYQQLVSGIPVEGATYILHVKSGKVRRQNGDWISYVPSDLSGKAGISGDAALQAAMAAFGAKSYKWQIPSQEAFIKKESGDESATYRPSPALVYYSGENKVNPAALRLAWKMDLYAQEPFDHRIYFVDAATGAVLGVRELIQTTSSNGQATTAYSSTQAIVTDSTGVMYHLQDYQRGNGVKTLNMSQTTDYSIATDFDDSDNIWNTTNANLDQYASDAHWGAEMTYDYFKNTFNRNSIDNAGYAIRSYVHFATNYFNAFWDGYRMTYGDGSSLDNYQPLTSVDICGHEITHGLTANTAGLLYSNESGALNEGFSDIFGTIIENYAKPGASNWDIGEAFYTLRSMSSPKTYGQPDTYQGTNWAVGTADHGGVHTNSGVLNYWFYLLANGGSGTNDASNSYSVTGIGMTKAAAIAYRTLTVYLTSTSQYLNARTSSIQSAVDLYGTSSSEALQVANAWNAVNVGSAVALAINGVNLCSDNYESNDTRSTAKEIALNTVIHARIGGGADKDWYRFTTGSAAAKLKVVLGNLPADYDLRLYNAAGNQLAVSQNKGTRTESITYNGSDGGDTYFVQVYGYNGASDARTCYDLIAATSNVDQIPDEPGDDDAGDNKAAPDAFNDAMAVSPNPAKGKLGVRFTATAAGSASLTITDILGRTLLTEPITMQEGENRRSIPLSNFHSGMYFLNIPGKSPVRFQVAE